MKYSFSTYSREKSSWLSICKLAKDAKFDGIELDNIKSENLSGPNREFDNKNLIETANKLKISNLEIPAINYVCDFTAKSVDDCIYDIREIVNIANIINCKNVNLNVVQNVDKETAKSNLIKCIENTYSKAKEHNIYLLIETEWIFSETSEVREMLDYFVQDNVCACWNVKHTILQVGESCDSVIKNLGAYIKHVHFTDAKIEEGKEVPALIGNGHISVDEVILALSSIDYHGYFSLVWGKSWIKDMQDDEIVFSHFTNFMSKYNIESKEVENSLYWNKSKTGKYIWKKEEIIDLTFPQVLDCICEKFPNQYAFRYISQDYIRTYCEFRDDVDEFARTLIALGAKKGTKVAVWSTNIPQWFIAFWACCRIGAVLVTMNTAYKIHEAEFLLKNSDTHTLIMIDGFKDTSYSEIIEKLCPELSSNIAGEELHAKRLPFLRHVINVTKEQDGCLTWAGALQLGKKVDLREVYRMSQNVNKHDVCNMQYTSGTTGFPKGVMLTHYNVVNNGKCIGDRMDLSTADKMMIIVPMFHCFGMVLSMTASVTHGTTMCPLPYFSTKPALQCINDEQITCFNGVPTMFIAMMQHPSFEHTDFSHIRTGIMAGSPCPISVMRDVVKKINMKEITIVYGQTEASPGCTMSNTEDSLKVRVETVGSPLPGIECKIIDPESGKDMPDGENGEFVARGYNVMKGYYKLPQATADAIDKQGWLHTGDIACKTKDGNFKITGRLKDMIIRGGENIYPKEIEEFIYTHPKVQDVQVIGVPDKVLGEEIYVAIIPKAEQTISEEEIKKYVSDNMAKHKVPKYIDIVDEFLMNAAGKILKYKMREQAIKKFNL